MKNKKEHCIIRYQKYKFDYIGIPKTGSSTFKTSIWVSEGSLKENNIRNNLEFYKPLKKSLKYINPTDNNLYTVIHFRNPVERFLSTFKDVTQGHKAHILIGQKPSNLFKDNLELFLDSINDIQEEKRNVHLRSQSWFVKHISVFNNHFTFRTEDYKPAINSLNNILGLNLKLFHINDTNNIIKPNVNSNIINKIEKFYENDFILWEKAKQYETNKN